MHSRSLHIGSSRRMSRRKRLSKPDRNIEHQFARRSTKVRSILKTSIFPTPSELLLRRSWSNLYKTTSALPLPHDSTERVQRFQFLSSSLSLADLSSRSSGEASAASSSAQPTPTDTLTRLDVSELLDEDLDEVQRLMDARVLEVFNVDSVFDVMSKCFISYKLTDHANAIVAVICMHEYPNVPALPSVGWSHWVDKLYNIKDLTSYNSLWVHLVAFDPKYEQSFLYPMLNNLFHEVMTKQFVLFVIPRGCHGKVAYLDGCSSLVLPQEYTNPMKVQTIRLCVRQDFITQYKIRRAVEEDNSDLVPLIHQFSKRFVELYGRYYVAEIISRHPEAGRKVIVAEHAGEAVSVLCLNPTVNYDELSDNFDLHVYTGLYKAETAVQRARAPKPHAQPAEAPAAAPPEVAADDARPRRKTRHSTLASDEYWRGDADSDDTAALTPTFSILDNLDDLASLPHSEMTISIEIDSAHDSDEAEAEASADDSSTTSIPSEPPFSGAPNAFAIEVLAARAQHQPSLALLIISCFECFPTRDYCLLTLPHDADYVPALQYFVRVQPRVTSQYPHELYVCHRGQLSPVRVARATAQHVALVRRFVALIKAPGAPAAPATILANLERGLAGSAPVATFVALSGKRHRYPVGVAQVAAVADLHAVKARYAVGECADVRRDSDGQFGCLLCLVLSPLFRGHLQYVLREIHRKTDFRTLFYAQNQHDAAPHRVRPLSFAMSDMWLVPPRKRRTAAKHAPNEYPEEPYALFMSTPKLMSKPRVQVNHRIVVVGASACALAFLEKLTANEATQCLVTFNNVLLVSVDGLERHERHSHVRDMLVATRGLRGVVYLERIALRSKIGVLRGTLTAIDRKNKSIKIDRKVVVPYDYLFLMTGLQYTMPKKRGASELQPSRAPPNCFTINTASDGDRALEALAGLVARYQQSEQQQIVVYGHSIDCYCCIAALLEFGIPGAWITFIDPWPRDRAPPPSHAFVFQDGGVYETAVGALEALGVAMRTGYRLVDWHAKPLKLKFEALTRYLVLTPLCAFVYDAKEVNIDVFRAIHAAGLVFDGLLVIDPDSRTNDASIYAAGPLTKYSRKLWADHLSHAHFNSGEVGARLGRAVRAMLLPFRERRAPTHSFGASCWRQSRHMVPYYFKPLMTYARLPGGLHYLDVVRPGPQIPRETAMSDADYGSVFSTGSARNLRAKGYFRVHLSNYRMVETITCLSAQKFDYRSFALLWGKHEALLNNLVKRFEAISISDLFDYFQKPWCSAIFLDYFSLLQTRMMKIMTSLTEVEGESPLEDLFRMYMENGFQPLSPDQRTLMYEKFTDSGYERSIAAAIMEFIRDNIGVLDMYAHPVLVNYILSGYEQSPMFKKM